MNRKRITFGFFFFLLLSTVASAQQATRSDIQALEAKITNLETTVREMDKRLTNQIVELDKRLTVQIQAVQTIVTETDKRLSSQINILFWAIGALIGLVLAVIALPQLLGYFQEKRARTDFQKQIDELEQRLEQYHREIEELKSRRLVMPF
jgi:chromosome segregation ATPase